MIDTKSLVPNMILEWTKGDKLGEQEIIDNVDIQGEFMWVNFKGGGRINGHAINEFMNLIGVAEPENVEKILQSKDAKQDELNIGQATSVTQNQTLQELEQKVIPPEYDFYFDILDKAKHNTKLDLDIKLDINFISKEKLEVLLEVYGDKLFDALKSYIATKINTELIDKCIEQVLLNDFPEFEIKDEIETVEVEEVDKLEKIYGGSPELPNTTIEDLQVIETPNK